MKSSSLGLTIFRGVVIGAVVVVAATGLYLGGAPSGERARRLDQQRVSDLDQLTNTVNSYYQANAVLPADIPSLLKNPQYAYLQGTSDPETGVAYDFEKTGVKTYRLCATFTTDTTKDDQRGYSYPNPLIWKHGVGRVCFDQTAPDPIPAAPAVK